MMTAKKRISRVCKIAGAVLAGLFLVAAPVLAQTYTAGLIVEETAGTGYTMMPVLVPLDTTGLIADFYLSATGLDSRVTDGTTYAHMLANDKLLFGFPLTASSSNPLEFSSGNAALSAFDIITGWGGYVTMADAAALEFGGDFESEFDGYVDTSAGNRYLITKGSFGYYTVTTGGAIQSGFWSWMRWVTPTGHVAGGWTNPGNAWDDNVGTFAFDNPGAGVWTGFLELTHAAIDISSVRYYCGGNHADIDEIDVDIFHDAGWHNVYQGAFVQDVWETKTLANIIEEDVTSIRIRLKNSGGAPHQAEIWEVDYGEAEPFIVTTGAVSTGEHTVKTIGGTFAFPDGDTLHFDGTATADINCGAIHNGSAKYALDFWFKLDAPFAAGAATDVYLWYKGFGGVYHQLFLQNTDGRMYLDTSAAAISSSQTTWAADTWYHVYAAGGQAVGGGAASNGMRLRIDNGAASTHANMQALAGGGNFLLGSRGTPDSHVGHMANVFFMTDDVTAAEETALYNGTPPGDEVEAWYVDEGVGVAIYSYGTTGTTGTAGGGCSWVTTDRPCDFYIEIDGSGVDGTNLRGASVLDVAADWVVAQDNSLPYLALYKHTVGGALIVHYEPVTYITGTTLPDREGAAQDGVITWGANPTGVSAVMGSLVPTGSYTAGDDPLATPDAAGEVAAPSDLITGDESMEGAWDTLFPFISPTATTTNTPAVLLVWFLSGAIVIGMIVFAHQYMQNMWITGLAAIVGFGIGIAMGAFPGWFLVVAVLAVIGIVALERSPSL